LTATKSACGRARTSRAGAWQKDKTRISTQAKLNPQHTGKTQPSTHGQNSILNTRHKFQRKDKTQSSTQGQDTNLNAKQDTNLNAKQDTNLNAKQDTNLKARAQHKGISKLVITGRP